MTQTTPPTPGPLAELARLAVLPRPDGCVVLRHEIHVAARGNPSMTGVAFTRDGRLALLVAGQGLALRLKAGDMLQLALSLLAVADIMAAEAEGEADAPRPSPGVEVGHA
jgi:hypothetical protein